MKNKPLSFQAQQDFVALVSKILAGEANINDAVSIKTSGEVNVKIASVENGFKVDFLSPEPTASITKFIKISDKIDYIIVTTDKVIKLKIRTWPAEISIEMPKNF